MSLFIKVFFRVLMESVLIRAAQKLITVVSRGRL